MNNVTVWASKDYEKLSNVTSITSRTINDPTWLALLLAGFLGIIPNIIIILGVHYKKSLRKPTYYLLANLALCDLLLSVGSLFTITIGIISRQNKIPYEVHATLCKIFGVFPLYLSYSASVQTLIIISGERYQAIFRPISKLTAKKAKILCIIAWIISLLLSFPFIITTTVSKKSPRQCLAFSTYTNWTTAIYVILFVFQFALPAVTIITLYSMILHQLRKTIRGRNESNRSKRLKKRTIYMLLTTTIIFLIFAAPWAISLAIMTITGTLPAEIIVHPAYPVAKEIVIISRFMLPFTAIYNPIVYCIFNQNIRNLYLSCCHRFICSKTTVAPAIQVNSKRDRASKTNLNTNKEKKKKYFELVAAGTSISHP